MKLLKSIGFDLYEPEIDIEEQVSVLEKPRSERSKRNSNADPPYSVPALAPPSAKMFFVCILASDESLHNVSAFLKSNSNRCTVHQQHNVVVVISTSNSKKKQLEKWLHQNKKHRVESTEIVSGAKLIVPCDYDDHREKICFFFRKFRGEEACAAI